MLTSHYALQKLLFDHSLYVTQIFINILDINAVNGFTGSWVHCYEFVIVYISSAWEYKAECSF